MRSMIGKPVRTLKLSKGETVRSSLAELVARKQAGEELAVAPPGHFFMMSECQKNSGP